MQKSIIKNTLILIIILLSKSISFSQIDEQCQDFTIQCADELIAFAEQVINDSNLNCHRQFVYTEGPDCTTNNPTYTIFPMSIGTLSPMNDIPAGPFGSLNIDPFLSVTDGIIAKSLMVRGDQWCDYVFEPDYKLQPLEEVEHFVKINKRLPGFKSEKEMVEDGYLNLEEITVKQQEKIEELFLHVILLNEEIDALLEK